MLRNNPVPFKLLRNRSQRPSTILRLSAFNSFYINMFTDDSATLVQYPELRKKQIAFNLLEYTRSLELRYLTIKFALCESDFLFIQVS
jgi:hypothetical protein